MRWTIPNGARLWAGLDFEMDVMDSRTVGTSLHVRMTLPLCWFLVVDRNLGGRLRVETFALKLEVEVLLAFHWQTQRVSAGHRIAVRNAQKSIVRSFVLCTHSASSGCRTCVNHE